MPASVSTVHPIWYITDAYYMAIQPDNVWRCKWAKAHQIGLRLYRDIICRSSGEFLAS